MTENSDDEQTPGHGSPVTNGDAREMRRIYEQEGASLREIGRQFGLAATTVSRAIVRVGGTINEAGLPPEAAARGRAEGGHATRGRSRSLGRRIREVPEDSLGGRIRTARLELRMSQVEFAAQVGMHAGTLSKVETNTRGLPPGSLERIIALTEKPTEYFTEATVPTTPLSTAALFMIPEARASVALDGETQSVGVPYDPKRFEDAVTAGLEQQEQPEVLLELESRLGPNPPTNESNLCYRGEHDRCHAEWCSCPHHKAERPVELQGFIKEPGDLLGPPKPTPQEEINGLSLEAMALLVEKLQDGKATLTTPIEARKLIEEHTLERLMNHVDEIPFSASVQVFGVSGKLHTRTDVLNWLHTLQYALKANEL